MRSGGIFARGLAMGAADIVPGVSGGTVAFISGIYPRLLGSLRRFDGAWLRELARGDFKAAWQRVDGGFLLALAAGIGAGILSLARLIGWLLENHPQPLWSFFFGLILASAILLAGGTNRWGWPQRIALACGGALAVLTALSPRGEWLGGDLGIFLAGFIAICAMLLPGISGSFILVLLGMYGPVLRALNGLDASFLLVFAAGAACGLLCFSRLLHWLLSRFRDTAVALLTGFLYGSLAAVWPWQRTLGWVADRHGDLRPAETLPVLPGEFLVRTGDDPLVLACLVCAAIGFALVWRIDRQFGGLHVDVR